MLCHAVLWFKLWNSNNWMEFGQLLGDVSAVRTVMSFWPYFGKLAVVGKFLDFQNVDFYLGFIRRILGA